VGLGAFSSQRGEQHGSFEQKFVGVARAAEAVKQALDPETHNEKIEGFAAPLGNGEQSGFD
jgi:hypothetical protein